LSTNYHEHCGHESERVATYLLEDILSVSRGDGSWFTKGVKCIRIQSVPKAEVTEDTSKMVDVASHIRRRDQVDESHHIVQSRLSLGIHLGIPHTTKWGLSSDLLNRHL
jgi:hypothetical protein